MILCLSVQNFTIVHVVISLMAIASGIVVLIGMFGSRRLPGWTAIPAHDGAHQPDGFPVSDPRLYPRARHWHRLVRAAGIGALWPLRQAPRRRLALDLRCLPPRA